MECRLQETFGRGFSVVAVEQFEVAVSGWIQESFCLTALGLTGHSARVFTQFQKTG